ncbi:MAG: hypothetical protein PW734_12610 [Verrucomicrobium sp.]|nr:hypothetical protein [Verrucomicrobium sp.]
MNKTLPAAVLAFATLSAAAQQEKKAPAEPKPAVKPVSLAVSPKANTSKDLSPLAATRRWQVDPEGRPLTIKIDAQRQPTK